MQAVERRKEPKPRDRVGVKCEKIISQDKYKFAGIPLPCIPSRQGRGTNFEMGSDLKITFITKDHYVSFQFQKIQTRQKNFIHPEKNHAIRA
jgi:hypothetical protein